MSGKPSKSKPKPVKSWYEQQPKRVETIINFSGRVIQSWRSPSRQCTSTTTSSELVEINGTHSKSLRFPCKAYTSSSSFPTEGRATMTVTRYCSPALAFAYCAGDKLTPHPRGGSYYKSIWIKEDCNIKDPYAPAQKMRFCNVVGFEGRFYAMSLQGSVVVIEVEEEKPDSRRLGITRIGRNRAVPSEASRHFREYMFVLGGEILVVLLVSRGSIQVVDDVEVFRLDIERLLWVKVEKIGNNTALILADKWCMWAEACEMGLKRDRVYFTHKWVDGWMVFDMETSKISKISNGFEGEWKVLSKLYLG